MAHRSLPAPLPEAPDETWRGIGWACAAAPAGYRAGRSLAQLLAKHRNYRNLAECRIFASREIPWADAYHHRKGQWPNKESGPVAEAPAEKWSAINAALNMGRRGLGGGLTLAKLLAERRGYQPRAGRGSASARFWRGPSALSADGGLADGLVRSARGRAGRELVEDRSCSAPRPARPAVPAVAGPVP